jgi:myo-inositol-1(or 4)-monophosphatase
MSLEKRKNLAIKACKEIGKLLLDSFDQAYQVQSKGDRDLVTEIDQKADRLIFRLIKSNFPKDGILSEESPHSPSRSGYRWIIDPIDGTHNFIHHIAVFGTSCALEFQGKVVLGIIYMPYSDEFYIARKGGGAYCNGKRLKVSQRTIREATLIYDSSIRYNKKEMLKHLGKLADKVFNLRMFGSTVRGLSYIAEGKAEAEIEFNDKVWDFAAGLLLVEEAGGSSTDFQGSPWNTRSGGYIASNGVIHRDLLKMMKGGKR